ncbi:MAG: hypothetical protein SCM96_00970 [Acidobacteriota bacterium]|nr:hypothetical protein [Acidobacteriota bacterium]
MTVRIGLSESANSDRHHAELMQKLNMVIGAFFSEVGVDFLERLAALDVDRSRLQRGFKLDRSWDDKRLKQAVADAAAGGFDLKTTRESIREMRGFLNEKRRFPLQSARPRVADRSQRMILK